MQEKYLEEEKIEHLPLQIKPISREKSIKQSSNSQNKEEKKESTVNQNNNFMINRDSVQQVKVIEALNPVN